VTEAPARLSAALADRYRIERELGAGGMATVYLAEDLKHKRRVAIKVLKPELAAVLGAERFVQEITTTASLSHPHILPLFDSGEGSGFLYYVMPYIEGETIRDRLNRETQLGIDEAVKIAADVADALDYAHRRGVIHRDIKPENILLHDGRPMVMDFGIALAVSAAAGGRMTETGLSLGTPHYMSPEQATADKTITARSDVYSLASVLYEMLTGEPPHMGTSAQQIIMKIIAEPVKPVTALRSSVPPNVAAALAKALEKLPADRFDSARGFAEALVNPTFSAPPHRPLSGATALPRFRPAALTATLAALLVVASALAAWGWLRTEARPVTRLDLSLGGIESPGSVAISPDGAFLAVTGVEGGERRLFVRRIGEADFHVLPGTEGASGTPPSFSPDGRWIVFESGRTLARIPVEGGRPETVVDDQSIDPDWPSWGGNDLISFVTRAGRLWVVNARGGPVRQTSSLINRPRTHVLPDGSGILVSQGSGIGVYLFDRDSVLPLLADGANPTYVPGGHLLYQGSNGELRAVRFDLRTHSVTGDPVRVSDAVSGYAVSHTGTLVLQEGTQQLPEAALVVGDWSGKQDTLPLPPILQRSPRVSPNGRVIAYQAHGARGADPDIYTFDLASRTATQITFDGENYSPVWSPDGRQLLFTRRGDSDADWDLWTAAIDNSRPPERVLAQPGDQLSLAWLGGNRIAFLSNPSGNWDIMVVTLGDSAGPTRYLAEAWDERDLALSPDQTLAAITSGKSGREEIWVRGFPDPRGEWRVHAATGSARQSSPRWSPDGGTLYFVEGARGIDQARTLFATQVDRSSGIGFRTPVPRLTARIYDWDLFPDGKRFVVVVPRQARDGNAAPSVAEGRYLVVLNWFEELRQRMEQ